MGTDILSSAYTSTSTSASYFSSSSSENRLMQLLTGESSSQTSTKFSSGLGDLLENLLTPTMENANTLAKEFSDNLSAAMEEAGLAADPPFELSADPNHLEITVTGDRDDLDQIAELINGNRELQQQYHNACAVASHANELREAMAFQQEYQDSDNSSAVIAKYSALFRSRQPAEVTMRFSEDGGEFLFDGEVLGDDTQDVLV